MNVGPDGAVALLAGAIIIPMAKGDPQAAIFLGAWLAVFTGIILIVAGKLRLGAIADFLSAPVLLGYLNGAAVVIILTEWEKMFGMKLEGENLMLRMEQWADKLPATHLPTLYVGLAVLGLLVIARLITRRVPPLVPVFFIAMVAGAVFDFESLGISVIGPIGDIAPRGVTFTLSYSKVARLAIGALGLAMLIFPESVLLSRAMADKHGHRINADQELVAIGASNIASGAVMGFSVAGSQTRTMLNSAAGGRTQVANLAAGVLLIVFVLFGIQWLETLPKVALAAILIFTGVSMIEVSGIRRIYAAHRPTALIAMGTTVAVIVVGVLPGILLGAAVSVGLVLAGLARPQDALLGRVEGDPALHDVGDDDRAKVIPGLVVYRFYAPLMFANMRYFGDRIQYFIDRSEQPIREVIIDTRAITSIDLSAADMLKDLLLNLQTQGITVVFAKAHLPLRQTARKFGLYEVLPDEAYFDSLGEAVAAFEAKQPA